MTQETITRYGRPKRPAGRAYLAIVALSCSGAALIAGCSSSSTSGSGKSPKSATSAASQAHTATAMPTGAAKKAMCVHVTSLRTSLTSLTHIKVSSADASKLTADLANIQAQLTALKGQNLGAFSTKSKELTAELNKIKMDAAGLSKSPAKEAMALNGDLTALKTKAGPVITESKTVCHTS